MSARIEWLAATETSVQVFTPARTGSAPDSTDARS